MEITVLKRKTFYIGMLLKLGVIISCCIGIYYTAGGKGFMGSSSMWLYFTIQSNAWIAFISFIFLIYDILNRNREISNRFYILKFIFTVSILLTFVVFAVLLSPLMPLDYLISPSNIFLHNITPILAVIDFILCDYKYESKWTHILYVLIMPLLYVTFTLILSFSGIMFGKEIVPYFFLNYEKLGWLSINQYGMGVLYWIIILLILLLGMGTGLLMILKVRKRKLH
ncbi:Pr6Pr family membrane protein [Mobilitalea sibirica]|uniref:Pr6Pr family membrane protein n=1 Tax=Mobilitalea sibirica TaxID=1462919 RepID=A0A8J7H9A0_9FIRM|nr:Pr6Pr family membrane protein [Mobilitalea sibirica]MBH1940925.1 Pr6Pr family membrane protein [Mobilitalea sibirica]